MTSIIVYKIVVFFHFESPILTTKTCTNKERKAGWDQEAGVMGPIFFSIDEVLLHKIYSWENSRVLGSHRGWGQ